MRKIFTIIAITVIGIGAANAASQKVAKRVAPAPQVVESTPCGALETPANLRVTETTVGYRKVEVTVDMKTKQTPEVRDGFAQNVTFAFGLESDSPAIRLDSIGAIKWISRCTADTRFNRHFYKAGTTWLKVRTVVTHNDVWPDRDGVTIRAFVWLPDDVAAAKPAAYTFLRDNVKYTGEWRDGQNGAVTLALSSE